MKNLILIPFILLLSEFAFTQSAADEQAINKIVATMAEAWTTGDAQKWSEAFSEDHDFVVWFGLYRPNSSKDMNAAAHSHIFKSIYKNTRQYSVVDKIRFIADDIAVIHVLAAVVPSGEPKPRYPEVLWSGVLKKENQIWKIVSFHNLDLEIIENKQMQAASPVSMDQMFASWSSE